MAPPEGGCGSPSSSASSSRACPAAAPAGAACRGSRALTSGGVLGRLGPDDGGSPRPAAEDPEVDGPAAKAGEEAHRGAASAAWRVGAGAEVFSRSAKGWFGAEVVDVADSWVHVEYQVGHLRCRKCLPTYSEDLLSSSAFCDEQDQEDPLEVDPCGKRARSSSLSEYFRARPDMLLPDGYHTDHCASNRYGRAYVLRHEASGIMVWRNLLQLAVDAGEDGIVLYHYTCEESFFKICRSKELRATLLKHGRPFDTCWGDGCYATCKAPDEFGSMEAVLVNNYTNTPDLQKQQGQIRHPEIAKKAMCCIPLFVPRRSVTNVMCESTCITNADGQVERLSPRVNRRKELIRDDRDIWVIALRDGSGDVTNSSREQALASRLVEVGRTSNALMFDKLEELLKDEAPEAREVAVHAISRVALEGDAGALKFLAERPRIREAAVRAVAQVAPRGDLRALEFLVRHLEDDAGNVRKAAMEAMSMVASVGDARVLELVVARLEDRDAGMRAASVYAVSRVAPVGDARALRLVAARLEDVDPRVRHVAVWGISRVAPAGSEVALQALARRLQDDDAHIRAAADVAMFRLGS